MPKLETPSLIKYAIHETESKIRTRSLLSPFPPTQLLEKLEQLETQLHRSKLKQLQLLIEELETKADIYGPHGRIFTFEHTWRVSPDGKLFHGDTEYQPETLEDGHARKILTGITW